MKITLTSPKKKLIAVSAVVTISLLSATPSYAFEIGGLLDSLLSDIGMYFEGIATDLIATFEEEWTDLGDEVEEAVVVGEMGFPDIGASVRNLKEQLLDEGKGSSRYGGTTGGKAVMAGIDLETGIIVGAAEATLGEAGQNLAQRKLDATEQSLTEITKLANSAETETSSQEILRAIAGQLGHSAEHSALIASSVVEQAKTQAEANLALANISKLQAAERNKKSLETLGASSEILEMARFSRLENTGAE